MKYRGMRTAACFLLFFLGLHLFAREGRSGEVWILENLLDVSTIKSGSTVLFNGWHSDLKRSNKRSFKAAVRTDRFLNPFGDRTPDLPSLKVLSAISDDGVREQYFKFFKRLCISRGIDYLVLPDTSMMRLLERQTIRNALEIGEGYFVVENELQLQLPASKREFKRRSFEKGLIWVVGEIEGLSKLLKWDRNLALQSFESDSSASSLNIFPVFHITKELGRSIFEHSASLLDPVGAFPIQADTIVYLGDDEYLKETLRMYATVLNVRKAETPVINDIRFGLRTVEKQDLVIQWLDSEVIREENTSLLVADTWHMEEMMLSQMVFGARKVEGKLDYHTNRSSFPTGVLGYSLPEYEGLNPDTLSLLDSLAAKAIRNYATPGIQIGLIKDGMLSLQKSYGYFTYDSTRPVSSETIYDLASLTKVMATLPALGYLIDQGKISIEDSLGAHLSFLRDSDKAGITIKQLLAHNSGLPSYVPFWDMKLSGDLLDPFVYLSDLHRELDIRTYEDELDEKGVDSLKATIARLPLKDELEYRYSDVGFLLLHFLVEEVSGQTLEQLLIEQFYTPMKMHSTFFNPQENEISFKTIAPTEYDRRYRHYQVWGEVHDRNASILGGIAGHAGLFSNVADLAKMMVMFLNEGFYGGHQYLSKKTVNTFNQRFFTNNRRGLGWDKMDTDHIGSASVFSSDSSYGHTGFTGTMLWADPEQKLGFIFLSNRIFPDASNWRLSHLNTRSLMHDVLYRSIED
ncbi:MAG: serine hydrolase [Bacteroidota bacterium]